MLEAAFTIFAGCTYMPTTLLIPYLLRYQNYLPLSIRLPLHTCSMLLASFVYASYVCLRLYFPTTLSVKSPFDIIRLVSFLFYLSASLLKQITLWKWFVESDRLHRQTALKLIMGLLVFQLPILTAVYPLFKGGSRLDQLLQIVYSTIFLTAKGFFVRKLHDPQRPHTNRLTSVLELGSCFFLSVVFVATTWQVVEGVQYVETVIVSLIPPSVFLAVVSEPIRHHLSDDLEYLQRFSEDSLLPASVNSRASRELHGEVPGWKKLLACFPRSWYALSIQEAKQVPRPPGFDELIALIEDGEWNAVDRHISQCSLTLLTSTDEEGLTPLHWAVRTNNFEMAEYFISLGSDPNSQTHEGWTSLHFAAQNDNSDIISHLHESLANINARTRVGFTPLHVAVRYGNMGALATLIQRGADINSPGGPPNSSEAYDRTYVHEKKVVQLGYSCKTPFLFAVECGSLPIVSFMCHHARRIGLDLDTPCCHGVTPLHIAVLLGHCHVTRHLLSNGCSAWTMNAKDNCSIFHYAAIGGGAEVLKLLRKAMISNTAPADVSTSFLPRGPLQPLHRELSSEGPKSVGYNVIKNIIESTSSEQLRAAQMVLQRHGIAYVVGMNPLPVTEMVDVTACQLDKVGSFQEAQDLQYAWFIVQNCLHPQKEAAESPRSVTPSLSTMDFHPEHLRAEQLICGRDIAHRTPLHYAVIRGHAEVCGLLVQYGADPDLRDIKVSGTEFMGLTCHEYVEHFLKERSKAGRYRQVKSEMQKGYLLRISPLEDRYIQFGHTIQS